MYQPIDPARIWPVRHVLPYPARVPQPPAVWPVPGDPAPMYPEHRRPEPVWL